MPRLERDENRRGNGARQSPKFQAGPMEGRSGVEVLREGTSLRGKDIIPELLLIDDPAPVSYNRFHADVPLEKMAAQEISRRIELLTGYSTARLQELVPGGAPPVRGGVQPVRGAPLEGRRLYMLAHLLIAKANKTSGGQGAGEIGFPAFPGLNILKPLLFVALVVLVFGAMVPWVLRPRDNITTAVDDSEKKETNLAPPVYVESPPPTKMEIFETRFSKLTKKFSQQKADVFEPLKTKLTPVVSEEGSALLTITGPGPTARAMAESLPWVLSKDFISIDPLQFGSLGTEHRNQVIDEVMKAWSDDPDDVLIVQEPGRLPTDVLEAIVGRCRTAMGKHGVVIAWGESGMGQLSGCGGMTALDVTRETGLAQPPSITTGDHEASISTLKKTFPSQSARLWQVSDFVIGQHLLDSDPRQPAMLILAGLPGANRTVHQLAESLAMVCALLPYIRQIYSEEPLVINSRQFRRVDPARGKLHLDRALDSAFRGGRRAAVLTELDALPPGAAMMLHSYCDHDSAQYKDVAYFMTLQLREPVAPGLTAAGQDRVVRERLREAWAPLGGEKRDPLISRIATMIVLVQQEDRFDIISDV
ncbi:nuclear membrane organization [Branchiostoma belcheri]|nr:nuclear membrane organization [Branchiostoma belcheri]